jgi:predicted amidohydrolase YtcJ
LRRSPSAPRGPRRGNGSKPRWRGTSQTWPNIRSLVPPPSLEESVTDLADACRIYGALGVGTIREALLHLEDWRVYQTAWERGLLRVRSRPMILVPISTANEGQAFVAGLRARSGFGDDWLRIWGLKFVMDGGVAGAGLEQPFANDPANTGHINWDPDAIAPIVSYAIANGWKVATHVVGDRTLRVLLDVYERALAENPDTPRGRLVIEHAFLANAEQRARAVRMGVAITVQHSLFYANSADMLISWGEERASKVMPVRSWLRDGAEIAAGTDAAAPFDPMLNVWGSRPARRETPGFRGPTRRSTSKRRYGYTPAPALSYSASPTDWAGWSPARSQTSSPTGPIRSTPRSTGCRTCSPSSR